VPKYTFICESCQHIETQIMSITEYVKNKDEIKSCPKCDAGVLFQQLGRIRNRVDKNSTEIMTEIREDVNKTVAKIKSGDERTIRNIYGDTKNPYKR
jgi:predicted nucleic acid-binding Zn ribbon protein